MVFNLDASVSNDNLRQIFGVYGEVKEVQILNILHPIHCLIYLSTSISSDHFNCYNTDSGDTTQEASQVHRIL